MALMTKMREKTHIVLGFLLVAFLALIVVEWGSESTIFRSKEQSGAIASINGQDIHYEQFARAFEQQIEQYKQQSGQEPQDSQLDYLRNQVWENMVREVLVTQEIEKRGIKASNKEILHYIFNEPPDIIRQNPSFQNEQGQFDNAKYQAALNDANMNETWRRVEDYMRATLPYQKFQDEFDASALVTDADVRDDYIKRNQKATVRYVFFNPENYRQQAGGAAGQIPVEKSAVEKYYNEHQDEFKEAEKRKIDYLIFSNKATHADSAAVRSLSEQILQRARSGEDFAALAGTYSEDESNRDKGGDLGFFKRGTMVKPFEDAAFGGNPGDIIGPVETTFGLHVIKIVGRKFEEPAEDAAANKDKKKKGEKQKGEEMVQASHVLLKYKASRQTMDAARDSASYFASAAKEAGWESALQTEKLTAQSSQPFTKGSGFVPGVGMKPAVASFVFRSEVGTISEYFEVPQGFMVLRVAESQKERIRPLEEVQAQIENTLRTDKLKDLAFEAAKAARAKLTGSMTLDDLAAQDSLEIKTPEPLTRAGFNRDIGRDAAFTGTAFSLQPNQISPAVKGARGAYLIQLLSLDPVNEADLQSQKETIRSQLVDRARQNAFSQWYADLKEKAAIKDFRDLYF